MESLKRFGRQIVFCSREAVISFVRAGWMSWVVISTMVVSLAVLGGFWLLLSDLNGLTRQVGSQVEVLGFLKDNADPHPVLQQAQGAVGVTKVKLIPKSEAWEEMQQDLKGQMDFSHLDSVNPLPDTIQVTVATPQDAGRVADWLRALPGIEDVKFSQDLIDRLREVSRAVRLIGGVIILVLSVATLAIVVNTIRLAVNARRGEIEIMRLVGATNWIVRMPFLLEGMIFGLISSVLSAGLLLGWRTLSVRQIQTLFAFLPMSDDMTIVGEIALWLIPIGVALGALGSALSVHRYLQLQPQVEGA